MELPKRLRFLIEEATSKVANKVLAENASVISCRYRQEKAIGTSLLNKNDEALSYAVVRMPATFGAVSSALEKVLDITDYAPKSLLDVGAGTGAATWAVEQQINLENIVCLEREKVMRDVGQYLMQESEIEVLKQAKWQNFDAARDELKDNADLVVVSYMLNELREEDRSTVLKKLWEATNQILLIVEPGTPKAFASLLKMRDFLLESGGNVIAPCPHGNACCLPEGDWCHFSCRIARSKLHKQIKSASMGYEDEKFCFLAVGRKKQDRQYDRVLKNPQINKASVKYEICSHNGKIEVEEVSSRDKNNYKMAKKLNWGDEIS